MKTLYLAVAITVLSVVQSASGAIAGSWTAKFEERTFIRLELKTVNGAIAGGLSVGNIQVDPQGVVNRADPAPSRLTPIFDVTRKGSTVTFFTKDGNDTDKFELRLLENADADLHFLLNDEDRRELAANGVPIPKPIRLSKGS
jgi:hypothetical protein